MSDKTDFAREYLAWKEALKFTDDSPEAFEEVQRLHQVDRRVNFLVGFYWPSVPEDLKEILSGGRDDDADQFGTTTRSADAPVIVVTEEDIEDVPLD